MTIRPTPIHGELYTAYGPRGAVRDGRGDPWTPGQLTLVRQAVARSGWQLWSLVPAAGRALLEAATEVEASGGTLRLTEVGRSIGRIRAARTGYLSWRQAGRPEPGSRGWRTGMKTAYVAAVNNTNHQWGGAIDVDVDATWPGMSDDDQLARLWQILGAHGWSPVISEPNADQSEAWHFDFRGSLAGRPYLRSTHAMCVVTGSYVGDRKMERLVQARLFCAGHDLAIDGMIGKHTHAALVKEGIEVSDENASQLVSTMIENGVGDEALSAFE